MTGFINQEEKNEATKTETRDANKKNGDAIGDSTLSDSAGELVLEPPDLCQLVVGDPSFVFNTEDVARSELGRRERGRLSIKYKNFVKHKCTKFYWGLQRSRFPGTTIVKPLGAYLGKTWRLDQEYRAERKKLEAEFPDTDASFTNAGTAMPVAVSTAASGSTGNSASTNRSAPVEKGRKPESSIRFSNTHKSKKRRPSEVEGDSAAEEPPLKRKNVNFGVAPERKQPSCATIRDDKTDEQTATKRPKLSFANAVDDASKKKEKKRGISFGVLDETDKQTEEFSTPKRRLRSPPPPARSDLFDCDENASESATPKRRMKSPPPPRSASFDDSNDLLDDIDDTIQGHADGGDSKLPAPPPKRRIRSPPLPACPSSFDDTNESDNIDETSIDEKATETAPVDTIAVGAAVTREQTMSPILIRALQENETFDDFRARVLNQNDLNAVERQEQTVSPTLINALRESFTFEDFRSRMLDQNTPK